MALSGQYGQEQEISVNVLVIGRGVAGCHAASHAAWRGATVAVVDKAPIQRGGSGGAGVDHWAGACTNPCSKTTPDEAIASSAGPFGGPFGVGHLRHSTGRESWDALLDLEELGLTIRDVDDELEGAVRVGELPVEYRLKPPYASTYWENYERHSHL